MTEIEKIRFKHRIQKQVLKRLKKEIYKKEERFCCSITAPHDSLIRSVALYRIKGLLSELNREFEDKRLTAESQEEKKETG